MAAVMLEVAVAAHTPGVEAEASTVAAAHSAVATMEAGTVAALAADIPVAGLPAVAPTEALRLLAGPVHPDPGLGKAAGRPETLLLAGTALTEPTAPQAGLVWRTPPEGPVVPLQPEGALETSHLTKPLPTVIGTPSELHIPLPDRHLPRMPVPPGSAL